MKKIYFIFSLLLASYSGFSQALTTEPEDFKPDDSVMFKFDIKAATNQSLLNHDPEDVYLWTWVPKDGGRPLEWEQGSWGASNPNLKLKYLGDNVWGFKMKPTEFYGMTAAEIYGKVVTDAGKGLKGNFYMLVKAKDGSAQTEDMAVLIVPPISARKVQMFPDKVKNGIGELTDTAFIHMDDAVTFFYDKKLEQSDTLKAITEFSVVAEGKLEDGATVRVSLLKDVGANPKLSMKLTTDNVYRFSFIPNILYKDVIPAGKKLVSMQLRIVKTVIGSKPTEAQTVEDIQLMKTGPGSSKKSIFYIYPVE